jgi:hypothetical protein
MVQAVRIKTFFLLDHDSLVPAVVKDAKYPCFARASDQSEAAFITANNDEIKFIDEQISKPSASLNPSEKRIEIAKL